MTQVFAEGPRLSDSRTRPVPGAISPAWHVGRQRGPLDDQRPEDPVADEFSPALTAGKGVRAVRCVGCDQPTLPRQDDNAPLCAHCNEVLAGAGPRPGAGLGNLWRRRRMPGV